MEKEFYQNAKIIDITPENVKKPCNTCKNKGLNYKHWMMIVLSFYMLFASIYGTVQLIKNLF